MIYGEDNVTRAARKQKEYELELNKMVPHQVFLWLPRQLANGRHACLQKVWRVAYDFDSFGNARYSHHETKDAALKFTKDYNVFRNNYKDVLREEVIKRLGS